MLRVPTTGQVVPRPGRVDVVAAGGVPGVVLGLGFPDVAEVVALGDCDDHGQMAPPFSPGLLAAGLPMIVSMNATVCGDMTMVSNRRFMIAGSDWGRGA